MRSGNKSICIVASTLPAGFIASQVEELGIFKIIVMSGNLELSFRMFKEKYSAIRVVCAPRGFVSQSLFFVTQLLVAKLRGYEVVFFHECCVPLLDLLLMLIKPRGFYFPHSTMSEWEKIEFKHFPKGKITHLIRMLGLVDRFIFYRSPGVGSNEEEYAISIKKYPKSIISRDPTFAREIISKAGKRSNTISNNILFITGKSFVLDSIQVQLFVQLLDIAHANGYNCYIKDHPNPIYRLNIACEYARNYDPFMPAELLEKDFYLVVGVSSTALLAFGGRSISLLNMIPAMSAVDRDFCIDVFEKLALTGDTIKYLQSVDEFRKLL